MFKNGTTLWRGTSIRSLIDNPIYIGIYHMQGVQSEPFDHLKIIDEDLFMRCQQAVKARSTKNFDGAPVVFRTDTRSLLTGIIFCGHCGCRLCYNHQHEERKLAGGGTSVYDYETYRCYRKISASRTCDGQSSYKATALNEAVEQQVKLFLSKLEAVPKERLVELASARNEETYKVAYKQPQPPVSMLNDTAREDARAFSAILIRQYSRVPSEACRKVDTHHMNLGMRFAMLLDPLLLEGYENFDVFSLNGYDIDIYPSVQKAGELTGKPIMVGEFHFGAPDAGMLAAAICSVATQEDRGKAYRAYYENAFNSPYFVGAHYFSLNDQCVLGRFDGENCQIGMVDVCCRPYETFTRAVTELNREVYAIADGRRSDPAPEVHRIPRMMGF